MCVVYACVVYVLVYVCGESVECLVYVCVVSGGICAVRQMCVGCLVVCVCGVWWYVRGKCVLGATRNMEIGSTFLYIMRQSFNKELSISILLHFEGLLEIELFIYIHNTKMNRLAIWLCNIYILLVCTLMHVNTEIPPDTTHACH